MTKTNEKRNFPRRLSAAGATRSRTDRRKRAGTDFGTGDLARESLLSLDAATISFNFPWVRESSLGQTETEGAAIRPEWCFGTTGKVRLESQKSKADGRGKNVNSRD